MIDKAYVKMLKLPRILELSVVYEAISQSSRCEDIVFNPPKCSINCSIGNFLEYNGINNVNLIKRDRRDNVCCNEIFADIEDIISIGDCQCFILRGDFYTNDNHGIKVIYYDEFMNSVVVWYPKFEELFFELENDFNIDNKEKAKVIHFEIMKEICDELDSKKEIEDKKEFSTSIIVEKRLDDKKKEWTVNLAYDGIKIDARVYHSIIKSIMISEDIKYSKGKAKGKRNVLDAYEDLIIKKMNVEKWKDKYKI